MQQPSTTASGPFEQPAYLERCHNIAKVLEYNLPWYGITAVVDLGCGTGDVGRHFLPLGCSVLFVDGRKEHIEALKKKCLNALQHDAHTPLGPLYYDERFPAVEPDLVLCLGLLYHSENPQLILDNCAAIAPIIAVETLCMDRADRVFLSLEEDSKRSDQSLDGGCSRFSPAWLERALSRAGYTHIEDLSTQVEPAPPDGYHLGFRYNWDLQDSGDSYRDGYGLRKLWVAWK